MSLKLSPTQLAFNARGDGSFKLPFQEQIDFFQQKDNLPTKRYDDILKSAHDRAFVVAGAMKADLLNDLRGAVDKAIADGKSIQWFRKEFASIVQKNGWEGWTGSDTKAGRDWRTRVIYNTNIRSSYSAGRYAQLTDPEFLKVYPNWKYVHNDSVAHPRKLHQSWSGIVLPHDDPWWQTHFPPNGWGCRCRVTSADPGEYKGQSAPNNDTFTYTDNNGKSRTIPNKVDYGWDYTPGASVSNQMRGFIDNKAASLPPELGLAFKSEVAGFQAARDYVLISGLNNLLSKTEFVYVYDELGSELFKKKGGESRVNFTDSEMTNMRDAQGVVLVHNHPEGRSLSKEDFLLAHEVDAVIYAIGHNNVDYSGKVLDIRRFESLYPHINGVLRHYFLPLIKANKLTVAEAELFHAHLVNTVLGASGTIKYDIKGMPDLPPVINQMLTNLLDHFK
jgi:uncharacterized protein with gpF-like domain